MARRNGYFGKGASCLAASALLWAGAAQAVMWFPVVNDDLAIISLNQESLVSKGRRVSAEFQYVFKRTETLPYADDERADTFKRMKTWLEFDCGDGTTRVLERTLIGERGDTVADGVPASLRDKRTLPAADSREATLRKVACGGLYGGD
ncbi:MAG: hypothetical protein FGM40_00310 [Rhodocyclaceae bacterium]|nr:hypothetical protein [Rhodocyclaceae bacterium]